PGGAFGPQHAGVEAADGGVADLVFVEALVQRDDVAVRVAGRRGGGAVVVGEGGGRRGRGGRGRGEEGPAAELRPGVGISFLSCLYVRHGGSLGLLIRCNSGGRGGASVAQAVSLCHKPPG